MIKKIDIDGNEVEVMIVSHTANTLVFKLGGETHTYNIHHASKSSALLQKDGELHTIDINEELNDIQRRYFDKSGYGKQIFQHTGNALEIIPMLEVIFDLIFIDAEKADYINYFESCLKKTTSGSIILSDNVLWSGKVVEPLLQKDKATKVLLEYNKKLKEDPRVETVLLPIRDGLTLSRVL